MEDDISIEERYLRQAKAATQAARDSIIWEGNISEAAYVARIEAFGRIAAALILADRES